MQKSSIQVDNVTENIIRDVSLDTIKQEKVILDSSTVIDQENNIYSQVNDIASQYDRYYGGGEKSMYNKRFGAQKIVLREKNIIKESFRKILKAIKKDNKQKIFRILDFGCGDGRLFSILEESVNSIIAKELDVELIGYDLSEVGLKLFAENLLNYGFKELKPGNKCDKRSFMKGNFLVTLIFGKVDDELIVTQNSIGNKIDLCLCMFGVIGHIPGKLNRIKTLEVLGELLRPTGELILSICATKVFSKEKIAYEVIRDQFKIYQKHKLSNSAHIRNSVLRLAQELGDLYYCSDGNKQAIDNYVHLYSPDELERDLKSANLCTKSGIKILTLSHLFEISNNRIKNIIDNFASEILSTICFSNYLKDLVAKHLFIKCTRL